MDENQSTAVMEVDEDLMLPEGYQEGYDFFGLPDDGEAAGEAAGGEQGAKAGTPDAAGGGPLSQPAADSSPRGGAKDAGGGEQGAEQTAPAGGEAPVQGPSSVASRQLPPGEAEGQGPQSLPLGALSASGARPAPTEGYRDGARRADEGRSYGNPANQGALIGAMQARMGQMAGQLERAERMARMLQYDSLDAMVDGAAKRFRDSEVERLTAEGTPRGTAEYIVDLKLRESAGATGLPLREGARRADEGRSYGNAAGQGPLISRFATASPRGSLEGQGSAPRGSLEGQGAPQGRSFVRELAELREVFPDAVRPDGHLPEEVVRAAAEEGKPLLAAYAGWRLGQQAAELAQAKQELEVMKQNAAAAAKAPVSGTAGQSVGQEPMDDFLRGFLAE